MIDTVLFDLDGTLLRYTQKAFLDTYLPELAKVFIGLGMDPEKSVKAVWAGTKAMTFNDGTKLNGCRFWETFASVMSLEKESLSIIEEACDRFYSNEFSILKTVLEPTDIPERLVRSLASRGYYVVLATSPFFPECAITTRLEWVGLKPGDFQLVTHYYNSTFCKPNLDYYREIFAKINKTPDRCIMAGNNPTEDMCASQLGTQVFLVTDYMENESGVDITQYRHGSLADLETFLMSLPTIGV